MHRLAASLARFAAAATAATMLVLAAAAVHADEGPAAPAAPAASAPAPDAQRPAPSNDAAQEDDREEPVVVPVPVEQPRAPVAPVLPPRPVVPLPQRMAPLPPPMPPSYYQQGLAPERTLAGRTHNMILPTGELLRDGEAEIAVHDFIYYRGAVALSDQVELNFSVPFIPAFAQVGMRVGILPRSSPFKVVMGGDAYVATMNDDSRGDAALTATLTVAYQTDRFNIHVTGIFAYSPSADDALGVTSIGATWLASRKLALFAEVSQVLVGDRSSADAFYTQTAGIKLLGDQIDVDLGFMFVDLPEQSTDGEPGPSSIPIPIVSATKAF